MLVASAAAAGACAAGTAVSAGAPPECFGAAARDPKRPCTNPTLSVTPAPDAVDREPGVNCRKPDAEPPAGCRFGAPAATAKRRFALVGDSHVYHWRAALDIVGKVKRWHGVSVWTGACYFSDAVRHFPVGAAPHCRTWYRDVRRWFRAHPEISTVFVTQRSHTEIVAPSATAAHRIKVAAFERTWKALPPTVRYVIVLRDGPRSTPAALECVRREVAAARRAPGPACAVSRRAALSRDAALDAAKRLRGPRYRHIDLTHYFCGRRTCEPVIGGVLVNRDTYGHITQTYARTLVPYLLRRLRALTRSWQRGGAFTARRAPRAG